MRKLSVFTILVVFVVTGCKCSVNFPSKMMAGGLKLDGIELPEGFGIHIYAEDVNNARSLCLGPKGTLFVGTRQAGKVYALRDTDGDFVADERYIIADKMNAPNGVALYDGDLYVAEIDKIWRFRNMEDNLAEPPEPELVFDGFPSDKLHGWKYIAFGPDGKLYVPVGAPCNICEPDPIYTTITRMDPDGGNFEIVASGIRNTVGFDWDPQTGDLWFTDNGRDWLGDDLPACELNHLEATGQHFGYPYCHQGDLADPKFGDQRSCDEFTAPYQNLGPHVAPLGMEFYNGTMFPDTYKDCIFIAEHGSWNRSTPIGYRVTMVDRSKPEGERYQTFAAGWLKNGNRWGRPVDLEWLPDGSMLISDDFGDVVYRVFYTE
jgi:glucose/arabinose dehydrogenase